MQTKKVMVAMMNYKGVMNLLNQRLDLRCLMDLLTMNLILHNLLRLFLLYFVSWCINILLYFI
jgi:hypothetical protein